MTPIVLLGNICIAISIGFCLFGMILFFASHYTESDTAAWWGRGTLYGNFILMTIANLAMVYALLHNDFSVSYVATVGSRETPRWVSAISLWSSLAGSILLWGWILTAYTAVCTFLNREKFQKLMAWSGLFFLGVQLFFFLLLAMPANPFLSVSSVPANGPGPNPLLQNHWLMVIHPPFLYMGYIGWTLPFAFALATLIEKDFSGPWLAVMRRWSLFAWSFLSMAIVLGGWWSYEVLGWGGYWAWDPVENASFMPWLSGTAFIHSLIVQEKRKMLAGWNLTLAVMTFLLTLLGTFLTRSGVLESVHSFTQSAVGPYFLVFIGIALVVSLSLLFWRASHLRQPGRIENIFSLEVLFLFNNLLFVSFCFIVFLGTFYPLIVEAVRGQKISVGEPYFNQMTVPITGMILLLMGVALMTPWKKTNLRVFLNTAKIPAVIAVVMTVVSLLLGVTKPAVVIVIFLSSFAFLVMLIEVIRTGPLFEKKLRRYSGFVSHAGALMIIVAVAISATYGYKGEVTLKKGESKNMAGYTLTLDDLTGEQVPQRFEVRAMMGIMKGKKSQDPLIPRMNYYPNSREPIASPAVRSTPTEDLYLTLLNVDKEGRQASFRVIVTPAVVWIWVGGVVVMMGGFLALALGKKNTSLPHE